ncbi:MAG: UDP-3-O-acyl-N-acetylglucosamine deacetylase [candidate division WOR-3 bacterium]
MSRQSGGAQLVGFDRRGRRCSIWVRTAPAGSGIVFNNTLRACVWQAQARDHATWLTNGCERVGMIEHLLAACIGLGVEDLEVEADGEELPLGDGSALPYVRLLQRAGVTRQRNKPLRLRRSLIARCGSRFVAALPGQELSLTCIAKVPGGKEMLCRAKVTSAEFVRRLAPARTFARRRGDPAVLQRRLGLRFVLENRSGWVVPHRRRFADEECRHKVLDLLGDVALIGRRVNARLVAFCPGHELNLALVREMAGNLEAE